VQPQRGAKSKKSDAPKDENAERSPKLGLKADKLEQQVVGD
jgi:hypothetical protein